MSVLLLRTYNLAEPLTIDILPEYAGCRSWIKMNANANFGRPALEDKDFMELKKEIEALVS
jgi:hypothetical protein